MINLLPKDTVFFDLFEGLSRHAVSSAEHLRQMVRGFPAIEIHHKESVGDDNHHAALSHLFDGQTDALDVIKWKELYDYIEDAIDGCEDVGNTLERIVLKNG